MKRFKALTRGLLLFGWCSSACKGEASGTEEYSVEGFTPEDGDPPAAGNEAGPAHIAADASADPLVEANTVPDAGLDPERGTPAPLACENYWDCPLSQEAMCVRDEGPMTTELAARGCEEGQCRYMLLGQSCGDGRACEGCRTLGRSQRCSSEAGDACTVCCYGILEAMIEHDIQPDLACACGEGGACAQACASSTACGGESAPTLDCLGCLRDAFHGEGTCLSTSPDELGPQVCNVRFSDELECSQLAFCLSRCEP